MRGLQCQIRERCRSVPAQSMGPGVQVEGIRLANVTERDCQTRELRSLVAANCWSARRRLTNFL